MLKKYGVIIALLLTTVFLHAQDAAKITYEHYLDFNLARLQGMHAVAVDIGVGLLDSADRLPAKARINFFNSMARLYEDQDQPKRATPLYEKVTAAEPTYYVAHRALGYIYLVPANDIFAKLNGMKTNNPIFKRLKADYQTAAAKAVKHLEIAQACDHSDDTLAIIKAIYQNMGDTVSLNTLNERLAKLGKNCLDILSD